MNNPVVFLQAVRRTYALHCLFALAIAGPLPVTQKTLRDLTGIRGDESVSAALRQLEAYGLAQCVGTRHKTAWQLSQAAQALQIPLSLSLADPEPGPDSGLKPESALPAASAIALPASPTPALDRSRDSFERDSGIRPESGFPLIALKNLNTINTGNPDPGLKPESALSAHLYEALAAANVFPQMRQALVDRFLSDDPARWLRSILGWICCAVRDGASAANRKALGARVYPVLSLKGGHRPEHAPEDCLPPADLPFADALAWALAGGQAPLLPSAPEESEPEPEPAPILTPAEQIWWPTVERMRLDLRPDVIRNWIEPLRPVVFENDVLLLAARDELARAYLERQLLSRMQRAAREALHREITIRVTLETAHA